MAAMKTEKSYFWQYLKKKKVKCLRKTGWSHHQDPDLCSSLFKTVQSTEKSVTQLKWVKLYSLFSIKGNIHVHFYQANPPSAQTIPPQPATS